MLVADDAVHRRVVLNLQVLRVCCNVYWNLVMMRAFLRCRANNREQKAFHARLLSGKALNVL